jgi:hypothetical protein
MTPPPAWRRSLQSLAASALIAALAGCNDPGPGGQATQNPTPAIAPPAFFLVEQFTATQQATRAVVDAGTIWLLDENGDFVLGADPAANWNVAGGLALTWSQVPGAAKYSVMVRNEVTPPTDWKELLTLEAPNPLLNATVVARQLNPWTAGMGTDGNPWAFGNKLQFAVVTRDGNNQLLEGGLSDVLETADTFPGVVTGIEIDRATLPVPFTPAVERGATFSRTIRLTFSEPMRTDAAPTLTSQSDNLTVRGLLDHAWGTAPGAPLAVPPTAAAHAFVRLLLQVKGPCTEVLVARYVGDGVVVVRDTAPFAAGAGSRILFLDGSTGALVGEATGIGSLQHALGRVGLSQPLTADVPAGALACALAGGPAPAPTVESVAVASLVLSDATPFCLSGQVAVHTPGQGLSAPVTDVRTVVGVDTSVRRLVLDTPLSSGHGSGSSVVALSGLGGEVALRPSVELTLRRDAVGGAGTELTFDTPAAVTTPPASGETTPPQPSVMVGDTLLIDADGNLRTTPDQAQARVKAVRFIPAPPSWSLTVDLPDSLILLHGRARVISLGDAFQVGGTRDTTAAAVTPLDPHGDQFTPDGLIY